ncbi:MAG: UvrB/UvrC motif-containing protein [Deltaproteobacteria bacterium]|nr:UvrB/UvrC motif-containing protein [Deltaproteobacteria bacterium]
MYETNDKPSDSVSEAIAQYDSLDDLDDIINNLKKEMKAAADELEFERAAELRDQIEAIKKMIVFEL